jgi:hypothetical protein
LYSFFALIGFTITLFMPDLRYFLAVSAKKSAVRAIIGMEAASPLLSERIFLVDNRRQKAALVFVYAGCKIN